MAGINCHRLLGLLAQTRGNPNQAGEHFEESLAYCRNAGYRPELGLLPPKNGMNLILFTPCGGQFRKVIQLILLYR